MEDKIQLKSDLEKESYLRQPRAPSPGAELGNLQAARLTRTFSDNGCVWKTMI